MQGGPGRRWAPARPGLGVQICCREDAPGPSEPAEGRTPTSAGPGALHPQGPAAGVPLPPFYKARDWLEPSEEEVAAASDKRCFLFPAWESISDKRGEKIVPLALRVQGESHAAAEQSEAA